MCNVENAMEALVNLHKWCGDETFLHVLAPNWFKSNGERPPILVEYLDPRQANGATPRRLIWFKSTPQPTYKPLQQGCHELK